MSRPWEKKSSRYLGDYPVFKLRVDVLVSPRTRKDLNAYVLESRDWTNIVPVTPEGEVVMVRQYRFATEEVTLEIPGGLIDPADESPMAAARREMREETGYDSDDIVPLGSVRPNPAILNNTCYMFAARNAEYKCPAELDPGEDILVERVPYGDIPRLIGEGVISHSIVLNAFFLYDLHLRESKEGKDAR